MLDTSQAFCRDRMVFCCRVQMCCRCRPTAPQGNVHCPAHPTPGGCWAQAARAQDGGLSWQHDASTLGNQAHSCSGRQRSANSQGSSCCQGYRESLILQQHFCLHPSYLCSRGSGNKPGFPSQCCPSFLFPAAGATQPWPLVLRMAMFGAASSSEEPSAGSALNSP